MTEGIVHSLLKPLLDIYEKFVVEKISRRIDNRKWNRSVQKAINATEGFGKELAEQIFESPALLKFVKIPPVEVDDEIYRRFILTLAMELCGDDKEKKYAIPVGVAVLENWLESNKIRIEDFSLNLEELKEVIHNREKLYRNYFMLFEDSKSVDIVRVYYPKNGESWIRWDKEFSVDIRTNLSKGFEYGFLITGFDYRKILNDESIGLKVAYIEDDKEILRFEDSSGIEGKKILWAK